MTVFILNGDVSVRAGHDSFESHVRVGFILLDTHLYVREDLKKIKLNEPGRQTLERQNSWQQAMQSQAYSDQLRV